LSARRDVAFLQYRITNNSGLPFDSAFVALWGDVDLGGASDDRMGSDPGRSLVYAYNGDDDDAVYGATPPAIGFKQLVGPFVSATNTYIGGNDPDTSLATWALLTGRKLDGQPWIDPGSMQPSSFPYSGDPVTNTGWIQPVDSELRMMLVSGPFSLQSGNTTLLTYAILVGQGIDRLSSITRMRTIADSIDVAAAFAPLVPIPPPPPHEPSTVLAFAPPATPHQGALVFTCVAPVGVPYRLDAYDVRGRRAARIAQGVGSGFVQTLPWAADVPSGVYFVSLSTASDRVTHRVVVLAP
jgi:hypothetical protein